MQEVFDSLILKGVEKVSLRGFNIDIDKYDILNANEYSPKERLNVSPSKYYSAEDYVKKALKKGYGVYFNEEVYYMLTLDNVYFHKSKIYDLKKEINNISKLREKDKHEFVFSKHLLEPEFHGNVKRYIQMYKRGLLTEKKVKEYLKNKVSDVDMVFNYDF